MIDNDIFSYFARLIFERCGIHYPPENYFQLKSRLQTLQENMGLNSFVELHQAFVKGPEPQIIDFLIDLATNNETSFFRDHKPFEALVTMVNESVGRHPHLPLRILSAACSTGQELYSIIMTILEKCPAALQSGFQIVALDIKQSVIDHAKAGVYTNLEVQRGLPIQYLIKYFHKTEDEKWKIDSEFLKYVRFQRFNLLKDEFRFEPFDIVFCRNVLIYQKLENKVKIVEKIHRAMGEDGFLCLGSSENLLGISEHFVPRRPNNCTIYQKQSAFSQVG